MKKRILCFLMAIVFSIVMVFSADRANTLKVYNWADYISPTVLADFPTWYQQQTGEEVEVIYNTFDINENMLTQIEVGKEDYDVICPSEYIIDRMLKLNLLQQIDKTIVPDSINYFNGVAPFAIEKFRQMSNAVDVNDYAVGYMWGTTGWLYNEEYNTADELNTWGVILDTTYENSIYMKDAYRDVYSVLVLYAYYDDIVSGKVTRTELVQNITQERIDSVASILIQAKRNVAGWEVDFGKEEMAKGAKCINLSWSGDAQWAIQEGAEAGRHLNYVVPKEGTNVWFDGWCIPKYAVNTKAATYFIDYMCRADNAIKNMEEIGYVSVIGTSEILAWAEDTTYEAVDASYMFGDAYTNVCLNPVLYPDKSVIERAALMKDADEQISALTEMWNKVKGDNLSGTMAIVMAIIGILAIIGFIIKFIQKRQLKAKQQQTKKKYKK